MNKKSFPLSFIILFLCLRSSSAQESVDVPQLLQENVHAFKLTIDSLETLTTGIRSHSQTAMQELRGILQRMQLLPDKHSRHYRLLHKEYEDKLAEYWARKYALLQEMEDVRLRTVSALDNVISHLQSTNTSSDASMIQDVLEEVRRTEDRISQTRLEMLRVLEAMEKSNLSKQQMDRLLRRLHLLENENLALYLRHRQRLSSLNELVRQPNVELPAMQEALLTMRDDLQSRYAWVETEMVYMQLYARHRQKWLDVDSRLVEISGMVQRFRDMVGRLNADREFTEEIEDFEKQLRMPPDTLTPLLELPPLQWQGRPDVEINTTPLTAAQIDSFRKAIQRDLESSRTTNGHN
jgi:hypothetical protein